MSIEGDFTLYFAKADTCPRCYSKDFVVNDQLQVSKDVLYDYCQCEECGLEYIQRTITVYTYTMFELPQEDAREPQEPQKS